MAREEDDSSPPTVAVADAEPAPSEALPLEGPIDLSTALDAAQVGLELMALVLAVPKGRAAAEAMARKAGAVIDSIRPPFSAPGDAEAFLVHDAIHGWLDATYGPGSWKVEHVATKREVGRIIVALEEEKSGDAHSFVIRLSDYRVARIDDEHSLRHGGKQ